MNAQEIIVAAIVAATAGIFIWQLYRRIKNGKSGCGSCGCGKEIPNRQFRDKVDEYRRGEKH